MKKLTNGSPLDLWNSGNLLDYLDECIHDSQVVASELIHATDNTDNKVDNVFTTSEFDTGLNEDQIEEIKIGLEDNLNVAIYAKKEFDSSQMKYIRWGLKENLDVSIYADTCFSGAQMSHIFWGLWHGLDVSIYADPKYSAGQMEELYLGVFNNIDVTPFADPKYHRDYMRSQRLQIELNTKASRINKSNEDKKKPAKRIFGE